LSIIFQLLIGIRLQGLLFNETQKKQGYVFIDRQTAEL